MAHKLIKTVVSTVFLITVGFIPIHSKPANTLQHPDFAFPKTVKEDSRKELENALRNNDPEKTLRAFMNLAIASELISSESTVGLLHELDSIALTLSPPFSAVAYLIEADFYNTIYSNNRWQFDRRTVDASSVGNNPEFWDRNMFADKINSLLNLALSEKKEAAATPLSRIESLIDFYKPIDSYTVYDFLVYQALDLSTIDTNQTIPFFTDKKQRVDRGSLIDQLLALHPSPSPARTEAVLTKAAYLQGLDKEKFLWNEIEACGNSPEAVPLLITFYNCINRHKFSDDDAKNLSLAKDLYDYVVSLEKSVTDKEAGKELGALLKAMGNESVTIQFPDLIRSDVKFDVTVNSQNLDKFYILLLKSNVKDNERVKISQIGSRFNIVCSSPVNITQAIPFQEEIKLKFSADSPGTYTFIASRSPEMKDIIHSGSEYFYPKYFSVSDIDVITFNPVIDTDNEKTSSQQAGCFVVNSLDCSPVKGAEVVFEKPKSYYDKVAKTEDAFTDKNGFASSSFENANVKATFRGSDATQWVHRYSETPASDILRTRLFTDRQVYRPGDTVEFFGIAFKSCSNEGVLAPGEEITVTLRNANYETVDSLILNTDSSGRYFGNFTLPKEGLLGSYSLITNYGSRSFEVAEYKVPSLLITLEKTESQPGFIEFKGNVATFSGMPLSDTKVDYFVQYLPSFFFFRNSDKEENFTASVSTDSEGAFRIKLPLGNLDPKEYRGIFTVRATATDGAGETAESNPVNFWIADSYSLQNEFPDCICVEGDYLKFSVTVKDAAGFPVIKNLNYKIENEEGQTVSEGIFESPVLSLPSSSIPSGKYSLIFSLEGDDVPPLRCTTVIYRSDDELPPYNTPLWVPLNRVIADGNFVQITYGSSIKGQHILCVITDSEGNTRYQWMVSEGRNSRFKVDAPTPDERINVAFITYQDHKFYQQNVIVIPAVQLDRLEIKTETFRKSLTPGESENWKFTLNYGNHPTAGYAYALLYDKAMDSIAPLGWPTSLFSPVYRFWVSLNGSNASVTSDSFRSKSWASPRFRGQNLSLETYGYSLYPPSYRSAGVYQKSAKRKTRMGTTMMAPEISMDVEMETAEESMVMNSMAATSGFEGSFSDDMGVATLESPMEEGSVAATDAEFRPIELPVAFFKPDLTAGNDGDIKLSFEVPDFNTTWNFIMGAYDDKLNSDCIRLESVASKKVMVRMLPPRFLRTGDKATITATVYNNSDETAEIYGEFEIFNPTEGKVLKRVKTAPLNIRASGNEVISIDFDCPYGINAVGLRVFANTGNASDGEQTVIPVLPSSQPVIESDPFYLAPGQKEFAMDIPVSAEDAMLTLKYCDNPIWEVVTALPPIVAPDSESLTAQISAFYANCVGKGIFENNSNLREGLRLIINGEAGDSLLVSNLEKDSDLKTVTLNNTPWVNDAKSETLRLSKLGTLLDETSASRTIQATWLKLMELRNPDGGWSWCKGMKSSRWMTEAVLINVGLLKKGGYLPQIDNIDSAVMEAIKFVEDEYVADFAKLKDDKDWFYASMLQYLYTRSFFLEIKSSASFERIRAKSLDYISNHWERLSIFHKATAAIMLWRNGKRMSAREILLSLKQFTSDSEEKGVWFDNLDSSWRGAGKLLTTARALSAFDEIDPADTIVDRMRQWMLLQRQAQDWQEGLWSIDAIDAILSTGSSWNGEYEAPEIWIGDAFVPQENIARLTGQVTANINSSNGEIRICRFSPTPAWGGVISQYVAPMTLVKADAIPDLSIRKEFWRIDETSEGSNAVRTDTLAIGDKVRVTMIIECGRDMDYVALTDERPACLEPSDQLSGYSATDGIWCYREIRNSATNLFFDFLPKGRHIFSYECRVMEKGEFSSGIATVQCLYSPLLTAHSAGQVLQVEN